MTRSYDALKDPAWNYPNGHTPLLDWWRGRYEHVFIALHPFCKRPPERHPQGCGSEIGVKAAVQVSWEEVNAATGADPFPVFALATLLAGYGMTSASRRPGMKPDVDDPLIERISSYVDDEVLCYPWDDSLSPLLEPPVGEAFRRLGASEVNARNLLRDKSLDVPVTVLAELESDWRRFNSVGPCELHDPDQRMLVTSSFDDIWSLIAMTDVAREAVRPEDHFEGFYAEPETTAHWVNEPGTYDCPPNWPN